jgi:glycine/D-amino acid oxidase-like deaminating enzyme
MLEQEEARRRWPLMNFDRVKAVLWCPSDGYMTPGCVVKAYADAAWQNGWLLWTSVSVEGIALKTAK